MERGDFNLLVNRERARNQRILPWVPGLAGPRFSPHHQGLAKPQRRSEGLQPQAAPYCVRDLEDRLRATTQFRHRPQAVLLGEADRPVTNEELSQLHEEVVPLGPAISALTERLAVGTVRQQQLRMEANSLREEIRAVEAERNQLLAHYKRLCESMQIAADDSRRIMEVNSALLSTMR